MTIPEILSELEYNKNRLPEAALRAAVEQREAITPELLRVLEAAAKGGASGAPSEDDLLHIYSLYLLAQFREKRAFAPLIRIASQPGEAPFDVLGDTVTEDLAKIFASVCGGDLAPLQRLIEGAAFNEYVRAAAIDALPVLENTSQLSRTDLIEYFRSLFHGKLERTNAFLWATLVCAVADIPAPELLEEVRWAYSEGLVDDSIADLPGIERDITVPRPKIRQHLIDDAISVMSSWACFNEEWNQIEAPIPDVLAASGPAPNFTKAPDIGRNDPCPCGSGRKYKKCCGK